MKYDVTLNGKVYEVEVERGEAILVNVADVATVAPVAVAAPSPVSAPAAPAAAPAAKLEGTVIDSPLPGVVVKVAVAVGESVKKGQTLVVVEAMKMENDIVAPKDGKVVQIAVSKGAKVETGAALLSLE